MSGLEAVREATGSLAFPIPQRNCTCEGKQPPLRDRSGFEVRQHGYGDVEITIFAGAERDIGLVGAVEIGAAGPAEVEAVRERLVVRHIFRAVITVVDLNSAQP